MSEFEISDEFDSDLYEDEPMDGEGFDDGGPPDDPMSAQDILGELILLVEKAKSMPLSSSAIVSRDDVLALLTSARDSLPGELVSARRLLQDHEELRASIDREVAEILDEARVQAAHMVQRTEIVRQAKHYADRLVEDAEAESRRIRHEADDYVDRKLAAFEIVLDRTIRTVRAGREKLSVVPEISVPGAQGAVSQEDDSLDDDLFDQDMT